NFCGNKQHCRSVFAHGDTGAAPDASGGVHRKVSRGFGHRHRIAVGCSAGVDGNEPTRLYYPVKGRAICGEVLNNRESSRTPRLDRDRLAIAKMAHVKLAGSGATMAAVREAV